MTLPEFSHPFSPKMDREYPPPEESATVRVYDSLAGLTGESIVYERLLEAYCSAFRRPPWNETQNTRDTVASKMIAQLTIPDTKPVIVTVRRGQQFGFAWGCDGLPETIVPSAVNNDFSGFDNGQKEEITQNVLGEIRGKMPRGEIFWGCELGTDPPGGSFFRRLVREEAGQASSDMLFGLTVEGTSFLKLMKSSGGYQEINSDLLPEEHHYFLQDLDLLVRRRKK